MDFLGGVIVGFVAWFLVRYFLAGLYTVDQNERAVKTIFGRAERIPGRTTLDDPIAEHLREDERSRYRYPQVRVIGPGGPYFKWPWERIYKVSVATQTVNMAYDPEDPTANRGGTMLEAVTKDQLNIGLNGQIRFQVSERNLYAYLFGVKAPFVHVMGYFISILRERIANFQAPATDPALTAGEGPDATVASGVSINDLRKNLRELNEQMERDCLSSVARYGILLDASLITGIDPPPEVESALAAINTAHNHVSSDISLAQAAADQRIVQSKRAVEIETLNAQAEVEPLTALAAQLSELKQSGPGALSGYLRNVRLRLFSRAGRVRRGQESGPRRGRPRRARRRLRCGTAAARDSERSGDGGGSMNFLATALITFISMFILMPILSALGRSFGLYAIVEEGTCHVYVLFGKVVAVLNEPGLYFLWARMGPAGLIVNWFGRRYVLDLRLDQQYLRSQPVNSEEGAPMGIGIWYEMYISDPVGYLFKNTDPRGSLAANVSNATVRCLSNMPLAEMLETRHKMSQVVREEVSPKSHEWGYRLGSVYIRKVHFRDGGMIQQIEEKVVNRLRQVTSAIRQDGINQVSIITSTAERQAAVEFARAQAMRPLIVGAALQKISADPEVASALFEILETQRLVDSQAEITLLPEGREVLGDLLASQPRPQQR